MNTEEHLGGRRSIARRNFARPRPETNRAQKRAPDFQPAPFHALLL